MTAILTVLQAVLVSFSAIMLILAIVNWKRGTHESRVGSAFLVLASFWNISYLLELSTFSLEGMLFWHTIGIIVSNFLSGVFFYYIKIYLDLKYISNRYISLMFLVLLIPFIIYLFGLFDELVYSSISVQEYLGQMILVVKYAPTYYLYLVINMIIVAATAYIFIYMLRKSHILYSIRSTVFLFSILSVWVPVFVYAIKASKIPINFAPPSLSCFAVMITLMNPETLFKTDLVSAAYRSLVANIQDIVIILDENLEILSKNASAEKFIEAVTSKALNETIAELSLKDTPSTHEASFMIGSEKTYQIDAIPLTEKNRYKFFVLFFRDVTELKRYLTHLEEEVEEKTRELQIAERMATIGQTTAMIGHDLRNPLQVINGLILLLKMKNRSEEYIQKEEITELLDKITEQADYASRLVSNLQTYAKEITLEKEIVSLPELVDEVLNEVSVPENIRVTKDVQAETIHADRVNIKRVFLNVVQNAVQSMDNGGEVEVKARQTTRSSVIEISDEGVGIPKENLEKVFMPLFTTKPKGTGLGLSVCKRIVEKHGGKITIQSELGVGTTIKICLPKEVE